MNVVSIKDLKTGMYTVYIEGMSEIVTQVKRIEEAPEKLSKMFADYIERIVDEKMYDQYTFDESDVPY